MTNDGLNTLAYDAENRLLSATNGGASGTYSYDGNSFRVKKVSGSTTTVYLFSGSKVIAEYVNGAAPTAPTREYIYSGDALLAKIESGATQYYHQDHLSNRLITDSSGNALAQLGHFPFGESWYNAPSDKFLFTTYERDSESGNDYAMARYSINRLGRFSSPDPVSGSIGDPQSLNRYPYTANDPIDATDPSGMVTFMCNGEEACPQRMSGGFVFGSTWNEFDIMSIPVYGWSFEEVKWSSSTGEPVSTVEWGYGVVGYGLFIDLNSLLSGNSSAGGGKRDLCNKADPTNNKVLTFIAAHKADASAVANQLNVPAQNILGLSAQESNYGQSTIAQAANNYFGQHAGAPGSSGIYTTSGGVAVATFSNYLASAQSFATAFGGLVQNRTSPSSFANALVPRFNPASTAAGGNPGFVQAVTGAINSVASRLNCP
jgi:RHS repeat-associated protein